MKKCSKCGEDKPDSSFYRRNFKRSVGLMSLCKQCHNALSRDWQRRNLDKSNATSKKSQLKRKHGLTLDDYDNLLAAQGGGCAICGSTIPGGQGRFHVDHDHKTGINRGLLCHHCNLLLGNAKDNPTTLANAISYLEKHDGR